MELLPTDEREHMCFICLHAPVKYRVDLKMPYTGDIYRSVCVCNRCAAKYSDRIMKKGE